jgi:predicted RND superfamily exporter protein
MSDKLNTAGFIGWIIRNKLTVTTGILIVTSLLGYAMLKIVLNADFSTYLRQDDPVVQTYNYIGKTFASKSMALVLIQADDVFNKETLQLIKDLSDGYEELDGIAYVTSLTVLSKDIYVNDVVSEDGKLTVIAIRLMHGIYEFDVTKEIKKITETIASNKEQISYGGMPFLMYHMTLLIIETVEYLEPVMIFLMIAILLIGFRRVGDVFVPFMVVAFSVIWTVGLMTLLGISLNMLTGIMPIILVAMGSADGIHIMKRYYEKRQTGKEPAEAIRAAFSELGSPIIITTLTTMIGFLSLLISNFSVIQQFGLVTSLGVFLALVATFLLVPTLLAFSRSKNKTGDTHARSKKIGFMDRWAEMVFKRRVAILLLTGVVVILSAIMLPRIKKDVDWSLCLKKGGKAHRAEMLLRRYFGGTVPIQALVKGEIGNPFTLKAMRYLERYMETLPYVGETQSMASLISEMNAVMNGRYVVPEADEGVANLWFLIEGEEVVEQLVNKDKTEGLVSARLASWDSGILGEALGKIEQVTKGLPEKILVVDLREVPDGAREILLGIRGERIAENLKRDLLGRKIALDFEQLRGIVENALSSKVLRGGDHGIIQQKVLNYLLSDEAELESISEEEAVLIARKIVSEIKEKGSIGPEKILTFIRLEKKHAETEDTEELAQSLDKIVRVAVGEVKVVSVLEKIREMLPPGAEDSRELLRDLKGDLWEMNEDLIALGMDEYIGLQAPPNQKIREISVSFENAGLASVLKRMEEELVPSQVMSLLIALVLTATALGLIFRSFAIGIMGMIPLCLTILVNFAVMGYFRIGLDSFTSMVASVAIGLGIDTDVHFISCLKREFSQLGDELKALKKTLSTTGVAILINALTVGFGFAILLFAGGQHVRRFGGLVALTVILSAIFTLTVLPAVIMLVKP